MKGRKVVFLSLLGIALISFSDPSSNLLCFLAYFIGYPALIISAFFFPEKKRRALYLYGCGVIYFLVQMFWLGSARYHGNIIILAYLVTSLVLPINFYLLGYMLPKKSSLLSFQKILFLALIFTFLEYARLGFLCGFPFHVTGLILTSHIIPLQLASSIGLYGLSFIVIVWALLGARSYFEKSVKKYIGFSLIPIALGGLLLYAHNMSREQRGLIKVAVVQTGLAVEEKIHLPRYEDFYIPDKEQLNRIWRLLDPMPPTDLVVFPEVTLSGDATFDRYTKADINEIFPKDFFPFLPDKEKFSYKDVFAALSIYLNTDILFGTIQKRYNAAVYLSGGEVLGSYNKHRLLPFGEYIPFSFLKSVAERYDLFSFFIPGTEKNILLGKFRILPTICFDECFPDDYLSYVGSQADVHINLTNDAWFARSFLGKSHYYLGIVRAVENGMYSIRACNTGISAIISPSGSVRAVLPELDEDGNLYSGILFDSFDLYTVPTFFSKVGNGGLFVLLLLFMGLLKVFSRKDISLKA